MSICYVSDNQQMKQAALEGITKTQTQISLMAQQWGQALGVAVSRLSCGPHLAIKQKSLYQSQKHTQLHPEVQALHTWYIPLFRTQESSQRPPSELKCEAFCIFAPHVSQATMLFSPLLVSLHRDIYPNPLRVLSGSSDPADPAI